MRACCGNCKFAEFPPNPTGNPSIKGQCTVHLMLPLCINQYAVSRRPVAEDEGGANCPCYHAGKERVK